MCRKRPSSVYIRVAVKRRVRLSPFTTCSSITCSPRDMRHVWYSPTADGPHTGHSLAHEQGRQRLSFVVDDVAPLGPFRHPNAGMSFRLQHSVPSIAFLSWTGASTRGIILGSPHSSVRLHTSVLPQSPPASHQRLLCWNRNCPPSFSKVRLKTITVCLRFEWETGLLRSTWKMLISTFRSSSGGWSF